ncbi:VanZ family protein [Shouchella shacheensis]|uniref:VanZ family protein n=1 Tax=Shouchella shacheensis TaxID=1649580 RepID=UPI00073FE7ED|nr:VanZ family protein [Shouchella shacheensis]
MHYTLRKLAWVAFIAYILGLLYVTLLAWNYGASLGSEGPGGRNYNLIPIRSIYRIGLYSPSLLDPLKILIGNIVLFLPLGFFLPLFFQNLRRLWKITVLGALLSFLIEIYQFTFTLRVSDIDDLILNTLGAFLGGCLFFLLRNIKRHVFVFHVRA